jgi:hypothetical protein
VLRVAFTLRSTEIHPVFFDLSWRLLAYSVACRLRDSLALHLSFPRLIYLSIYLSVYLSSGRGASVCLDSERWKC